MISRAGEFARVAAAIFGLLGAIAWAQSSSTTPTPTPTPPSGEAAAAPKSTEAALPKCGDCHTDTVADDIALQAGCVEVQPIFYRGQKIGERRRINTRLLIHVQNRQDAERRRAEDRAERRELLVLRAELAQQNPETSQPATPAVTAAKAEMCCGDLGLADAA